MIRNKFRTPIQNCRASERAPHDTIHSRAVVALAARGLSRRPNDDDRLLSSKPDHLAIRRVPGFAVWTGNPFLGQLRALNS